MNTELLLREHLEAAAEDVVLTPSGVDLVTGRVRRGRWMWGIGVAAVLVAAVAVVGLVSGGSERLISEEPSAAGTIASEITALLPASFDQESASPLFVAYGDAATVAMDYLNDRLPNNDNLGAEIVATTEVGDGFVEARWAWGDALDGADTDPTDGYFAGWVLMRFHHEGAYGVIAATTDRVDFSDVRYVDGLVTGTVRSNQIDMLSLDILTMGFDPVPTAPFPDGAFPEADYLFGSAGVAEGSLPGLETEAVLDLAVDEQVVVRGNLVGGSLLSISEVAMGSTGVERTMGFLLEGAEPAGGDGALLVATARGPAPEFDPPGEELALETDTGWEDLDVEKIQESAGGPEPVGPMVYIGRQNNVRMVAFEATPTGIGVSGPIGWEPWLCVADIGPDGEGFGMGCGTRSDSINVSWGAGGPYVEGSEPASWSFIFESLGRDASVVVLETDQGTYWQRPIAGFALFVVEYSQGETAVVAVHDAAGDVIATETLTLE